MTFSLFDIEGGSIMFSAMLLIFSTPVGCYTQKTVQWMWEGCNCFASLNMSLWIIVNMKVRLWDLRFSH
jgi:hypothetical protein